MDNDITITIVNWEKFNGRGDIKKHSWFRCEHSMIDHPDILNMGAAERFVWIFLLGLATRRNSATVPCAAEYFHRTCGDDKKTFYRAIEKLQRIGWVTVRTLRGRYADVTSTNGSDTQDGSYDTLRYDTIRNDTERDDTEKTENLNTFAELEKFEEPKKTAKPKKLPAAEAGGQQVWAAYSEAFENRYGIAPVRNAKTNAQAAQIAKRLGKEGPDVARFFLAINDSYLLRYQHPIGSLLTQCEAFWTQWKRNKPVTSAQVRNFEQKQQQEDSLQTALDMIAKGAIFTNETHHENGGKNDTE